MSAPLPSIADVLRRLRPLGDPRYGSGDCLFDAVRVLDAVVPLLEDADVDWTTRTTEHEAAIRALLAPADATGGGG